MTAEFSSIFEALCLDLLAARKLAASKSGICKKKRHKEKKKKTEIKFDKCAKRAHYHLTNDEHLLSH